MKKLGSTEEYISKKIDHIADTFLGITGRNASSKMGLSITEYLELRKQAIWEISQGFDFAGQEPTPPFKKAEPKEDVSNVSSKQTPPHPPDIVEIREENVTVEANSIASAESQESDSVREKFRRLKDL